ncbi:transmembrane protein 17B-like isoform 1-T1 [Rhinophrynus dorsalis]
MALQTPLPCNVRHGLASISGSVFIQNKTRDCGDVHTYHKAHEVVANLPLQMMLYFNALFFPFWFVSEIITVELKYHLLNVYYQFLLIIILIILTLVEILRLYLGYIGNLHEKVPELAGFLLLTFLIQMPLILFLVTDQEFILLPLEFAVHVIYMLFINAEITLSFLVLKTMTRKLATQFYLHQPEDLEDKHLPDRVTEHYDKDAFMY